VKDNQSYYQNYIDEVKPYRTQMREYVLKYDGQDVFSSNITDFDAPGFYDTVTRTYRKPNPANVNDTARLSSLPNVLWANNRKLQVSQIVIDNAGVGYVDPPVVTIAGGGGRGATAEAAINFATGKITSITVTNPGAGYTEKPVIYINGSGARDTGYPSANIFISGNAFGGTVQYDDKECAMATIGTSLTSGEISTLYTLIQNFQTSLSRQV
jgi:hypothetical protein